MSVKIKRVAIAIIVSLLAGAAIGYYFGYGMGFERAVRLLAN